MQYEDVFYSIGQVSEMTGLPQSALRYWETVFDVLKPKKSPGGNRQYLKRDIDIIFRIKDLLYEKAFTIKGANHQLNQVKANFSMQITPEPAKETGDSALKQNKPEAGNEKEARTEQKMIKKTISELKEIIKILE